LIASGHARAWDYTPAQAIAFVKHAERRQRKDRAQQLELVAMAFRSEAKDINKRIRKDWDD